MDEFASVLRAWRDRVRPEEAGLPGGGDRRTPGLRREELAALAGVSVEYLIRLEQGRATHPSAQLLGALARALRLTTEERDHLFRVAGAAIPATGLVPTHLPPGVLRMLDRLGDLPLAVYSASWDPLLENDLWLAIGAERSPRHGIERNVAWRHFVSGYDAIEFDAAHRADFSGDLAADLRGASGRYPSDPGLADLIARLRRESPEFEERWGEARVALHRSSRKTATATPFGSIRLDCDVLSVPGEDLRIVLYSAVPGSTDASKLDALRVVGAHHAE